ncbi:MAG: hypothetical protein JAY75_05790 [Candidatus Thiodiazotropha taylori]|nr:hypothetical protein [Candidatus Thiodiazotropha taylori]MCW4272200.1 hypothetical protein [Candidatus Thiodiazotropha endolucinida]MCG8031836.1 hypothetical protein [Candidatus Thiodiazotropha taylori]MCG8075737.1 hypothetical protein [Candidatus Thiodiazotropha taylori]MCW4307721.1 hypothetical protein [Candidatus Thiodiazotropha endolucinida]
MAIEVALVSLRTPHDPAPEATQCQLGEQFVQVLHHRAQTTRCLACHLVQQLEEAAHDFGIAKTGGRQRQVGHDQGDDTARGVRGEFHHRLDDVGNDVLADLLGHAGHLLDVGQDQVLAPAQCAEGAHAFDIVLQAAWRHDALRFVV